MFDRLGPPCAGHLTLALKTHLWIQAEPIERKSLLSGLLEPRCCLITSPDIEALRELREAPLAF